MENEGEVLMDRELRDRWITALRSGDYKQCRQFFKNDDGEYCCLGVLCVVLGTRPTDSEGGGNWSAVEAELPGSYPTAEKLATMNDEGSSFSEIADYIEKNL